MTEGRTCLHCGEMIDPGEVDHVRKSLGEQNAGLHFACFARLGLGSLGHMIGLCECDGGPGVLEDPPGLTKRQAAHLAFEYSQFRHDNKRAGVGSGELV